MEYSTGISTGSTNSGRKEKRNYFDWWKDKKIYLIDKGAVIIGEIAVMYKECGRNGWDKTFRLT